MQSSSSVHPSAAASAQASHPSTLNPPRRPSRFDPMGHESDADTYEDLGHRYPLKRVEEEGLSLPSIKSLFADSRPFHTGSTSSFSSSTGSPNSSRNSRYSSLASANSDPGWWAPESHQEPDAKRRRSDMPAVDEEAARLKYQAQSRNASFPLARPPLSVSASPVEHGGAFAFSRRESGASRSSSFSGQLARSFADLSTERGEMLPPMLSPQDRRPSMLRQDDSRSRGASPERSRSSLTEQIMAKAGDDVAMAKGVYSAPMKSSVSEPPPWTRRDSDTIQLNSDNEGPSVSIRRRSKDETADPMRGMEILAESAKRAAAFEEEEPENEEAGPKYRCAYCAKTFSRPSSLRIHTYSHTGERPFVCKEPSCRRRFSVQSNLKRHAKVHQIGSGSETPPITPHTPHVHPPNHVFSFHPRPFTPDGVYDPARMHPPPYPMSSNAELGPIRPRGVARDEEEEDEEGDELEDEEEGS